MVNQVKKQPEKEVKGARREVILPIKKYLAKFILFNRWDKLNHPVPGARAILIFLTKNTDIKNDLDLKWVLSKLLKESLKENNCFLSIAKYKSKSGLFNTLKFCIDNNYSLIKIKVLITSTPVEKKSLKDYSFEKVVSDFNRIVERHFMAFCFSYIDIHPVKIKAIKEIYTLFGLTEKDIKIETLRRRYFRKK